MGQLCTLSDWMNQRIIRIRQVVNLSDRQAGASESEDHDKAPQFAAYKASVLQPLLRCYHMRNGSSNLTGIMSSRWQGEKDNALKLHSQNMRWHCYEAKWKISCNLSCVFNIQRCTFYQVKHQRLSVVHSHVSKMSFEFGILRSTPVTPCTKSQACRVYTRRLTPLLSTQSPLKERTRTNSLAIWKLWISTDSSSPLPVLNCSGLLSESIPKEPSFASPFVFTL